MHSSIRIVLFSLTLFASMGVHAQSANPTNHEAQIRDVIESFRVSIIEKDKPRFLALFHGMTIPWLSVLENKTLANIRERRADRRKADPLGTPGPEQFIDEVVGIKMRLEEKFSNIRIETDGNIASVYFDYSFHQGEYMSNFGTEAWHLLNTDHGWKITSVIYSVEVNPKPPAKRN